MSLINDMLKDLEERGQSKPEFVGSDNVAPVSEPEPDKRSVLPWKLIFGGLFLTLLLVVGWQYSQRILAFIELRAASGVEAMTHSKDDTSAHKDAPAPSKEQSLLTGEVLAEAEPTDLQSTADKPTETESLNPESLETQMAEPPIASELIAPKPTAPELLSAQWDMGANQGTLLLTVSTPVPVRLLKQESDEIRIHLNSLNLSRVLPAKPTSLVDSFSASVDEDGLVVSLSTQREAQFALSDKLLEDGRGEVKLSFALAAVTVAKPLPLSETETKKTVNEPVSPAVSAVSPQPQPKKPKPIPKDNVASGQHKLPTAPVAEAKPAPPSLPKQSAVLTVDTDIAIERQAKRLLNQGDVGAAETLLKDTLTKAPDYLRTRTLLSGIYIAKGRTQLAHEQLDAGLNYHPASPPLLELKARLAVAESDWQQALTYLEQSNPSMNDMPSYFGLKASALQNLGKMEESAGLYYALLEVDRTQVAYWVGLGYSLESLGRISEAREAYQSSLRIPQDDNALRNFVNARLSSLGQ